MRINNQLIFNPRVGYRHLLENPSSSPPLTLWLRKPAFVALVLGCSIALMVSAALRLGLVLSTSLCWTFVPLAELIGLQLVLGASSKLTRAQRADMFFASHTPWLVWIAILGIMAAFMPVTKLFAIFDAVMVTGGFVVLIWSLWMDFHFFRVCGAGRAASIRQLALQRLISWTLIVAVFSYGSFWPSMLEVTAR